MKMNIFVIRTIEKEVLPCPFCGKENLSLKELVKDECFSIYCEECGIYGIKSINEENAIDLWNTRKYIPKK